MEQNPFPPSFNPPIITVGWNPVSAASISPIRAFHYPLPDWPEMTPQDGFATYARKIALDDRPLIPKDAKITIDDASKGADAYLAAVLLVLRQHSGVEVVRNPKVMDRSWQLAQELAHITRAADRPWQVGSRLDGTNLGTSPEVIALAHKASTDACLTLLMERHAQFLYQVLGGTVTALLNLPPDMSREEMVALLEKNFPPARKDMQVPEGMRFLDDFVCVAREPDTRWRPVVVLETHAQILIHPGWFRADRKHSSPFETLSEIAKVLTNEERSIGSNAAWVAVTSPLGLYRNRSGSPRIESDRLLELIRQQIHTL